MVIPSMIVILHRTADREETDMTLTASQTLITVLASGTGLYDHPVCPLCDLPRTARSRPRWSPGWEKVLPAAMMGSAGSSTPSRGFLWSAAPWHPGIPGDPGDRPAPPGGSTTPAEHRCLAQRSICCWYRLYSKEKIPPAHCERRDFLFAGECFPVRGFSARGGSGESAGAAAPG